MKTLHICLLLALAAPAPAARIPQQAAAQPAQTQAPVYVEVDDIFAKAARGGLKLNLSKPESQKFGYGIESELGQAADLEKSAANRLVTLGNATREKRMEFARQMQTLEAPAETRRIRADSFLAAYADALVASGTGGDAASDPLREITLKLLNDPAAKQRLAAYVAEEVGEAPDPADRVLDLIGKLQKELPPEKQQKIREILRQDKSKAAALPPPLCLLTGCK